MSAAVVELCAYKLLVTACTPEFLESGEHFPEDIAPRNLFLPEVHHKLIDVPMLIGLVLGDSSSVEVDVQVGLGALVPLSLVASVQSAAVHTTVQHVVLLLKQVFKLLHEEFTRQLVLFVDQLVQVIKGDLTGQSLDQA
jgi:hypothetical protein